MAGLKILQWNARGLLRNGRSFKQVVEERKPDVICVQESFLKPSKRYAISGYTSLRRDRPTQGGGLVTFVIQGLGYTELSLDNINTGRLEKQGITVLTDKSPIHIINIYNPPQYSYTDTLQRIHSKLPHESVYVGDFNAHHELLGSRQSNVTGRDLVEFIEDNNLCFLSDGTGTRIDPVTGNFTSLDNTITTHRLAGLADWLVVEDPCGSDHLPVLTTISSTPHMDTTRLPRSYIYSKADWPLFQSICQSATLEDIAHTDINQYLDNINTFLHSAASKAIPCSSGKTVTRPINPAWTPACTQAKKDSRHAFRQLKQGLITNTQYNQSIANTRKVIDREHKAHWETYVSTLNKDTRIRDVWGKVKSLQGKPNTRTIPTLGHAVTPEEKANTLAASLANASSHTNLEPQHQTLRAEFEVRHENHLSDLGPSTGPLNAPFSVEEFRDALSAKRNTAPGGDKISYVLLKHSPSHFIKILLHFLNRVFITRQFPTQWKEATVIPLLKPGKNRHSPDSYRPISLTSHLCKVTETMLNNRLRWFLDTHDLLDSAQSGFRKGRSTIDQLVKLETQIKCANMNKQLTGVVFLDISKAFDLVWHNGLLYKLKHHGIQGHILHFIKSFLLGRTIQVSVNQILSNKYPLENGTPQGSVISPTLFNIMANDLADEIKYTYDQEDNCDLFQFADDNTLSFSHRDIKIINSKLQESLDTITSWSHKWGFKLSEQKTSAVLFGKRGSIYSRSAPQFSLTLNNKAINIASEARFLGVIFDRHLSFASHISSVVTSCQSITNLMRCVSGTKFGADKPTLLLIYKALIRSRLDYGCQAFHSGAKIHLNKLDRIQYQALRTALGAHRSTPIEALLAEAGELPLSLRRDSLTLRFWARVRSNPDNPVNTLFTHRFNRVYNRHKVKNLWNAKQAPFGYRVHRFLENTPLGSIEIAEQEVISHPPWLLSRPNVSVALSNEFTKSENPSVIKAIALEYLDTKYQGFHKIYTDGSKDPDTGHTGAAYYDPLADYGDGYRCTDHISVYTSELIAINEALDYISNKDYSNVVILSDSLSALQSLVTKTSSRPDILNEILVRVHQLQRRHIRVHLEWIPAHVGIIGNETVDSLAKESTNHSEIECNTQLGVTEAYTLIRQFINQKRSEKYNNTSLFIRQLKPNPTVTPIRYSNNVYWDKVFTRLRLGTTLLNGEIGQYIFKQGPQCSCGHSKETVEHFIMECPTHNLHRGELHTHYHSLGLDTLHIREILDPPKSLARSAFEGLRIFITNTGYIDKI